MNTAEILTSLEYDTGTFPRKALGAAIQNKQEIVPGLLRFVVYARENAEAIEKQESNIFMGHLYALFLLAQFREQSAYEPIIDLFGSLPDETILNITGEVITEDFHRILVSVFGGDDTLIRKLVENESAPPFVRGAAIESFITMMVVGLKTRQEVIDYYSHLFKGGLRREFSFVWNMLVASAADVHPGELYEEILKAYNEDLFETGFVSMKEIEEEKNWTVEKSLKRISLHGNHSLINDTIAEMEWWACFKDRTKKDADIIGKGTKFCAPAEYPELKPVGQDIKIGRNAPCTCGSGKKYKKCCGKNV